MRTSYDPINSEDFRQLMNKSMINQPISNKSIDTIMESPNLKVKPSKYRNNNKNFITDNISSYNP